MEPWTRRRMLETTALALAGGGVELINSFAPARAQEPGERPAQAEGVTVLNPRARVPVSLIIDDSTCLVNLAHFCIPQFHEVFPENYQQPWKTLPREIPDAFVRKFGEWCHEHGVKGKYSVIPYPACVGWLDRDLPGWSKKELDASLELVRTLMAPDWDFHPEIVSHTWVIDTKTGRSYPERSDRFMENWRWTDDKSADQIADYMSYALRVLKNVGVRCEGITTPGGFGIRVLPALAQATLQACRDVFQAEIPHYYRHSFTDEQSVAPRVEYASGLDGSDPRCVISIIACTGDWFGGWDGLTPGSADRFITADLQSGRLPEVIARGEPAIMASHWPGMFFNGREVGFSILKEVVKRLHTRYDSLIWMKLSDIARYWVARTLTRISRESNRVTFHAPFACPRFTVKAACQGHSPPELNVENRPVSLREVAAPLELVEQSWVRQDQHVTVCFDLPRGTSHLNVPST